MNLQELTAAVAKANPEINPETVTRFVNAFFASVTESLVKDGNVKISGFGTFVHTEEPHHRINFIPSEEMAGTVNAPFSMFEPEELGDDVTDQMLEGDSVPAPSEETMPEESESEVQPQTPEPAAQPVIPQIAEPQPVNVPQPEAEPKHATEPLSEEPDSDEPANGESMKEDTEEETEKEVVYVYRNVFPWWYALIAGLVAGAIIGGAILYTHYDTAGYYYDDETEDTELTDELADEVSQLESQLSAATVSDSEATDGPETTDSITAAAPEAKEAEPEIREVKPAEPEEPKVITEKVSAHNYLTTMAKHHYGKDVFWAYIYLENASKLKHPDRISPNTIVVIPPASKYGIDKNDPKSVAAAKQKGAEIYSKYK